jgi:hypothetical protein
MNEKVITLILLRISFAIDEGRGMKADGRGKKADGRRLMEEGRITIF